MEAVNYFKALADETRLRIINLLYKNELGVTEVVAVLGMGQSRISRHLKILSDAGLVISRKDGLWVFYRANENGVQGELIDLARNELKRSENYTVDMSRLESYIKERGERGREFFNSIASDWRRIRREILGGLDINPEIVKMVKQHGCVADLGCGNGELAGLLLDKCEKVIGVDRSTGMLDEAGNYLKSLGRGEFDLRLGELSHLPVRDGEADCAVINMVLHYLDDPPAAVAEAGRILKPGGMLVIAELENHQDETLRKRYGHRWLGFSRETIKGLMEQNGFGSLRSERFTAGDGFVVVLYNSRKTKKHK